MSMRSLSVTSLFVAFLFAASAQAHDPSLHELPAAKAKHTTCEQLADTKRYSAELADKALKTKCDADEKRTQKNEGGKVDDKDD